MCTHTGPFDTGVLACVRTDTHLTGHIYQTTDGSHVNDHHPDGGHG